MLGVNSLGVGVTGCQPATIGVGDYCSDQRHLRMSSVLAASVTYCRASGCVSLLDSSVTQSSSEPTLVSAFQLRPSSLKAPSIKLLPTPSAPNEGGPSIVSAGFSLTNQRSSITLGFSARQQLEQWSSLHGQPDR